jgi:hypothetical protein
MKKIFFLFTLLSAGFMIFTGQKSTNEDSRWNTAPMLLPNYAPIPRGQDNYINPNTTTRYYNTPSGVLAISPNFRVLPKSGNQQQTELYLASNKMLPNLLLGGSNATNGSFISDGVYVSTNGGANWFGYDTLRAPSLTDQRGDPGPAIDKNGIFHMTHLTSSSTFGSLTGIGSNRSSDFGNTWAATFQIVNDASVDKNLACSDDSPTSPFFGNTYVAWTKLAADAGRFSRTTDGGLTWSAQIVPGTASFTGFSQGHDPQTGPNGQVYVAWAIEGGSPTHATGMGFSKSTDGGLTFTATPNIYTCNGTRSTSFNGWSIRTNDFPRMDVDKSGGLRNGWIYIVTDESNLAPAGSDADVVLHKSTDGGTTWSAGIRVNQDGLNNGKAQFFPVVKCDPYGGVNVIYFDSRNFANSGDSCAVFMSRSIDGGTTWTDVEVTDHHFKPKATPGLSGGYMGDYLGFGYAAGKLWPFWTDDNVNLIFSAWTAGISIGPAINHTPLTNSEQISGSRAVNAQIIPAGSNIIASQTKLLWSKNSVTVTDSVLMTNTGGTNWTASIPLTGAGTYRYYIKTADSLNRTATAPAGAPGSLYTFVAAPDLSPPIITHTPIGNYAKPSWPATVTATVTDNLGLDSVWVKWSINNPNPNKQFKLINTSGSSFSAPFNSLNSDVQIGDSIYYKIFAQDNSAAHNRDSSAQVKFKIVNVFLCEGFTDPAFPPANWSITATGTVYWTYNTVSSYGIGTGSAKFDFWSAASNTTQSLNSLVFGNTIANDTLRFDEAYAPYTSGTDSLIVYSSTNAGGSFTRLATLWGNAAGGPLNTAPTSTSAFTPTSTQWATKKYVLPVGTNQVRFTAVSGFGNNLYIDSICVRSTGTGVQNIFTGIPTRYKLDQNYPNPFNPVTKINFALPKQGLVTLKIYDLVGREVATLINEVRNAGYYTADFNGLNFSSGVYFYKLTADDFIDTKRMVLIK